MHKHMHRKYKHATVHNTYRNITNNKQGKYHSKQILFTKPRNFLNTSTCTYKISLYIQTHQNSSSTIRNVHEEAKMREKDTSLLSIENLTPIMNLQHLQVLTEGTMVFTYTEDSEDILFSYINPKIEGHSISHLIHTPFFISRYFFCATHCSNH